MMNSNTGTSIDQKITGNEHRKRSLGAIFTLIATPDSEEISIKRGDRLRKCIKDIKQTTAQFAKDFIDQQYAFLYDICKQEAKHKPCNLTLRYGNGSTTQVMVRYENEVKESQLSVLEISFRIYVKLAEKGMVSILHADDELYEQLESTASNPSELYITTSKKADYCEALIGRNSIANQSVILMIMKKNGNGFVSINPDASAAAIENFIQINRECNDKSSITPVGSFTTSQLDNKKAPVARPQGGGTSSDLALKTTSVANISSAKPTTRTITAVAAQAHSGVEKIKYSTSRPPEKATRGIEQSEAASCDAKEEIKNGFCSPTKTALLASKKRKTLIVEGEKKGKKVKKPKDPNAPTRPLSSYFLFCAEMREELKKKNAGAKAPNGKELGISFGNLSQIEKAKYDKEAADLQKQYAVKKAKYDQKKAEADLANSTKDGDKKANNPEKEACKKVEEALAKSIKAAGKTAYENQSTSTKEAGIDCDGVGDLKVTKQSSIQRKRQRSKKDPNAPKRPMSNYLLYCNDHREKTKMANPGATQQTILKILSEGYRNMNEKDAAYYKELFEDAKEEYREKKIKYETEKEAAAKSSNDGDDDYDDDNEEGQTLIL